MSRIRRIIMCSALAPLVVGAVVLVRESAWLSAAVFVGLPGAVLALLWSFGRSWSEEVEK